MAATAGAKITDLVEKEIEAIRRRLQRQRSTVYRSVDYITKQLIANSRKRPFRTFLASGGQVG